MKNARGYILTAADIKFCERHRIDPKEFVTEEEARADRDAYDEEFHAEEKREFF